MSDSVWPHRREPTRLCHPWDSSGKNTGMGCHFLLQYIKVKSESEVAQSCPTVSDPMDCSLPGSCGPWDLAGKGTGVRCHCLLQKRAEGWRTDAFKLWCWRRLLRVLWTARRPNQSTLKKINPEYSLQRLMLMLMLKLQYFGHLLWRANSLEKTLMLGKIEGRRRGLLCMRLLDGITDSLDMSLSKLREILEDRRAWHATAHGVTKSPTWLGNWTIITILESEENVWKSCMYISDKGLDSKLYENLS